MNAPQGEPPSPLPVLYSFRRCPYAMRARLALRHADIRCELREVVLRDKPEAMLRLSPKGTVPVLAVPAQGAKAAPEVLDESLDIMLWALHQRDPDGWLDADPVATQRLIAANDDDFKPALDRYKYPDRYPDSDRNAALTRCEQFLAQLDQRLAAGGALVAARPTLADFAVLPFVRQFAMVDAEWLPNSPHTAVNAWLDDLLASQLFESIMHKTPPWQPGAAEVQF